MSAAGDELPLLVSTACLVGTYLTNHSDGVKNEVLGARSLLSNNSASQLMYEPTKEIAEEQYARLKAASPTEWAQGYSVAFTMKKASEYLRASLCMPQSLFSSATDCESSTAAIFCAALASIQTGRAGSAGKDLVQILSNAVDVISPDQIPAIVDTLVAPLSQRQMASDGITTSTLDGAVRDGSLVALDLLPKLLWRVATKASPLRVPDRSCLVHDLSPNMDGQMYVTHAVRIITSLHWPPGCQTKIVEVLKDMMLPPELLHLAATKATRQLQEVPLDDIPALTYQLLLLGSQMNGIVRDAILHAIISHFNKLDALVEAENEDENELLGFGRGSQSYSTSSSNATPLAVATSTVRLSRETVRAVEGNVIQLFNFAASQDQGLGKSLLKIINGEARNVDTKNVGNDLCFRWLVLTQFTAAMALSIMHSQRFTQPVMDMFQKLASEGAKHAGRLQSSLWLAEEQRDVEMLCKESGTKASKKANLSPRSSVAHKLDVNFTDEATKHARYVPSILFKVVRAGAGWDKLIPAMVSLGFALVDKAPKEQARGGNGDILGGTIWGAALGKELLLEIYTVNSFSREAIVNQILERIVTRAPGIAVLLELFCDLSTRCPHDLLGQSASIRNAFGYLMEMDPVHANELLRSVIPLFTLQPSLMDAAVLPLRKACFSREESVRHIGAEGILLLLASSAEVLQWEEASLDSLCSASTCLSPMPSSLAASSHGVAHGGLSSEECFCLMRRSLSQQEGVRRKIYRGLVEAFSKFPPLRVKIFEFLLAQFRRYFKGLGSSPLCISDIAGTGETEERISQPLFDPGKCVASNTAKPHIVEPLGELITSMARVVAMTERDADVNVSSVWPNAKEEFQVLADSIAAVDLCDFNLDKSCDFSTATPRGAHDLCRITVLKGVVEGFMFSSVALDGDLMKSNCDSADANCDVGGAENERKEHTVNSSLELENKMSRLSPSQMTLNRVLKLFQQRERLLTLVNEATVLARRNAKSRFVAPDPSAAEKDAEKAIKNLVDCTDVGESFLDSQFLAPLLRMYASEGLEDNSVEDTSMSRELSDTPIFFDLRRFVLKSCLAQLESVVQEGQGRGATKRALTVRKMTRRLMCTTLGPLLYKVYKDNRELSSEATLCANSPAMDVDGVASSRGKGSKGGSHAKKSNETTAELALQGYLLCLGLLITRDKSAVQSTDATVSQADVARFVWDSFAADTSQPIDSDEVKVILKGLRSLLKHLQNCLELSTYDDRKVRLGHDTVRCLCTLASTLTPHQLESFSTKVRTLCTQHHTPTVKLCEELSSLHILTHGGAASKDLRHLYHLGSAVKLCLGNIQDDDTDADTVAESSKMAIVEDVESIAGDGDDKIATKKMNKRPQAMASVVTEIVGRTLETTLGDVDYVISLLKKLPKPPKSLPLSGAASMEIETEIGTSGARKTNIVSAHIDNCSRRLLDAVRALEPLMSAKLKAGKSLEKVFAAARRIYDATVKLVNLVADHRFSWLSENSKAILSHVSNKFTPVVFRFISYTLELKHTDKSQLMSQLNRQSTLVPALVERIESLDVAIGNIAKICKTDNVHVFIKRNATRDFKINSKSFSEAFALKKELDERKRKDLGRKEPKAKKKAKAFVQEEEEMDEEEEGIEEEVEEMEALMEEEEEEDDDEE